MNHWLESDKPGVQKPKYIAVEYDIFEADISPRPAGCCSACVTTVSSTRRTE